MMARHTMQIGTAIISASSQVPKLDFRVKGLVPSHCPSVLPTLKEKHIRNSYTLNSVIDSYIYYIINALSKQKYITFVNFS